MTKDADFVNTFTVQRVPYKLLLVSTGNITNAALETLVTQHMADITQPLCLTTLLNSLVPCSSYTCDLNQRRGGFAREGRWGLRGEYQVPWFLMPLLLLTPGDILS